LVVESEALAILASYQTRTAGWDEYPEKCASPSIVPAHRTGTVTNQQLLTLRVQQCAVGKGKCNCPELHEIRNSLHEKISYSETLLSFAGTAAEISVKYCQVERNL
jgi:hypothetical protein